MLKIALSIKNSVMPYNDVFPISYDTVISQFPSTSFHCKQIGEGGFAIEMTTEMKEHWLLNTGGRLGQEMHVTRLAKWALPAKRLTYLSDS